MNTADITADDLIALVRAYNPKTNENQIRLAFEYGQNMHEGQYRHSGELYFTHPVAVAAILTEQQLDDATIITALLHDTIEDTKASFTSVEKMFGRDVAELVDGVTKLTNLQLNSTETKQAENFRKLFMAMSKDLRVILVKLADRLHNMRTIKSMRPDKQIQKARETMDIYAPLAGRMGMQWMREELEDLAFRVLNPEGRQSIIRRFITLQRETGDVIQRITGDMRHELEKAGIEAEVFGRAKKPIRFGVRCRKRSSPFPVSQIYMVSGLLRTPRMNATVRLVLFTDAGGRFLVGSRIISASLNRMDIGRSTPLYRGVTANGSRSRLGPGRCTMLLNLVWRRIGRIATGFGPVTRSL